MNRKNMNLENIAKSYFAAFEQKKIEVLEGMFHENVSLKDWNISAVGKQDVLSANASIFKAVDVLKVDVENLYVANMTVIAELSIYANNDPAIPVIDIISFADDKEDLKITSIVAYRGN
jgi:hypothetical protein|tara:strand:+ start:337 stop:693 length:357 start_codon:yes stop_codon:yes gene_type:complete